MSLRELHLFAGAGGGILGGLLLGHRCVGAVEISDYCQKALRRRQADGMLPPFPIHGDIRTFDGVPWRGKVDVVCGGFPCQDISHAGNREGLDGARSSLWWEMHRVIREVRPRYVFVENVAALLVRGFDRVLGSLADLGFDAEWCVLSAAACGAPHERQRLWILATDANYESQHDGAEHAEVAALQEPVPDAYEPRLEDGSPDDPGTGGGQEDAEWSRLPVERSSGWWEVEPAVGRVVDGMADRMDRLRAIGNGQVPLVAARAFQHLMART